eukprot:m.137488 g.137488  ORF g.137488 m.137488 type:complete len:129 (+) comp15895_c2_seq3:185-571(+)
MLTWTSMEPQLRFVAGSKQKPTQRSPSPPHSTKAGSDSTAEQETKPNNHTPPHEENDTDEVELDHDMATMTPEERRHVREKRRREAMEREAEELIQTVEEDEYDADDAFDPADLEVVDIEEVELDDDM